MVYMYSIFLFISFFKKKKMLDDIFFFFFYFKFLYKILNSLKSEASLAPLSHLSV